MAEEETQEPTEDPSEDQEQAVPAEEIPDAEAPPVEDLPPEAQVAPGTLRMVAWAAPRARGALRRVAL